MNNKFTLGQNVRLAQTRDEGWIDGIQRTDNGFDYLVRYAIGGAGVETKKWMPEAALGSV